MPSDRRTGIGRRGDERRRVDPHLTRGDSGLLLEPEPLGNRDGRQEGLSVDRGCLRPREARLRRDLVRPGLIDPAFPPPMPDLEQACASDDSCLFQPPTERTHRSSLLDDHAGGSGPLGRAARRPEHSTTARPPSEQERSRYRPGSASPRASRPRRIPSRYFSSARACSDRAQLSASRASSSRNIQFSSLRRPPRRQPLVPLLDRVSIEEQSVAERTDALGGRSHRTVQGIRHAEEHAVHAGAR